MLKRVLLPWLSALWLLDLVMEHKQETGDDSDTMHLFILQFYMLKVTINLNPI